MDQQVLYFKEGIMIQVRFLCERASLYWHQIRQPDGDLVGFLSELQVIKGIRGNLAFELDKDYAAFYIADNNSNQVFYLCAISPHLGKAFRIYKRTVPQQDIREFTLRYQPRMSA